jgi:hypothetical protein
MMGKINDLLNKYFIYAVWAFLAISLLINVRSCGASKDVSRLKMQVNELTLKQDSLMNEIYTKNELDTRLEILGYEVSKRMLYDQNAIVRTAVRPDDAMNQYDQKINELRKKLE